MAFVVQSPSAVSNSIFPHVCHRTTKAWKFTTPFSTSSFPSISIKHPTICCTNTSPWESAPVTTYAPTKDARGDFLKETASIFETLTSETSEDSVTNSKEQTDANNQTSSGIQYLKWPMWLLGPSLLLATGMVPTLWLPISSIFLGPNIASLLSLAGLDCIFNLGASLFLLMADSCARGKQPTSNIRSIAPSSYQFWNMVATLAGFVVPLILLFNSQKGFLQPQLPFISFAVLLGPYLLLLSIQMLTEMLTWHWKSPVWLVTPIVYEAYRVLQLMRSLKLGAELTAPAWMLHTIRVLVCWWVLVLGIQLMRVAWYAGFTARSRQHVSSDTA